ncbi:hypothetical protein D3C72_1691160 [compost metagenome]
MTAPMPTPECTGPTTTSTWEPAISFCMFGTALPGLASLSTTTYSTGRPPRLLSCCSMASFMPLVVASPKAAKVPV